VVSARAHAESLAALNSFMNYKIKLVSHHSFGFRTVNNLTAPIYHCCAHLPLPEECRSHFWERNPIGKLGVKA
jgi:hypothetical protein